LNGNLENTVRCRVVKNTNGEVVAAYPIVEGDVKIELQLEKGEQAVKIDIPEEDMRDPHTFLRACSSAK
jgi:hypothetical protein